MATIPCGRSQLKAQYQIDYDECLASLTLARAYYAQILAGEGIESGKFDSGESMSWWKYTDPVKFYKDVIVPKEAQLAHIRNAYNGTGIVRLNLSRGR